MTDLKRVRELLEEDLAWSNAVEASWGAPRWPTETVDTKEAIALIDAHLKEDAELNLDAAQVVGEYIEDLAKARTELAELREAVRAALHELGVPDENYAAPVANAVDILSRQLIEDKE